MGERRSSSDLDPFMYALRIYCISFWSFRLVSLAKDSQPAAPKSWGLFQLPLLNSWDLGISLQLDTWTSFHSAAITNFEAHLGEISFVDLWQWCKWTAGWGIPSWFEEKWVEYRAWLKDYCMSFHGELQHRDGEFLHQLLVMVAKHQVMGRRWATQDVLQGHMLQGAHDSDRSERWDGYRLNLQGMLDESQNIVEMPWFYRSWNS